ncbi:MAG: tyrosine-type recombinase/integrase [Lachnospiraceae bacterium]
MPRGRAIRNKNGYGAVVKLSGSRRHPYEVRVNTRMDERYYPVYDVLGRFATREEGLIALAEYNKNPYDLNKSKLTFHELYEAYYHDKYELSGKTFSKSSMNCTRSAYNHMELLHDRLYKDLRANDFKAAFSQTKDGKALSHAMQEHMKNLIIQMDKFALENDIISKGYASFAKITVDEDDKPGVPFTPDELMKLWQHKNEPWVDAVLIYTYSGWRISELNSMPLKDISLSDWTFRGGVKTAAGKDRIVPIHSAIRQMTASRMSGNGSRLFMENGKPVSNTLLSKRFKAALVASGITTPHTVHDCRHTFTSLLDTAGANPICIDRLVGHASKSITSKIYTHKDIEELRAAVELIKAPL